MASLEPTPTVPIVTQPEAANVSDYLPMAPTKPGDYAASLIQLMSEFVSGGSVSYLAALKRTVPQYIDRLTQEYGDDLYELMMSDSDVASAIEMRKNQILADGMRVEPAVKPPRSGDKEDQQKSQDADDSKEIAEFIEGCIDNLPSYTHELTIAHEILDALFIGNKAAEKILDHCPKGSKWEGKLWWRDIKPRNRRKLAWILDSWNDIVGFFSVQPDKAYVTIPTITIIDDPRDYANFLPEDKFLYYIHRPKDGDPRGTSLLNAAYAAWIFKTQVLPQYFNNLRRHGGGTLVGKTDKEAAALVPQTDPITGVPQENAPQITKEQALLRVLIAASDQTAMAVPGGTEVDFVQPEGHGEAFLNAFTWAAKQIHQAILTVSRDTQEAENSSQADNGAAGDISSQSANLYKKILGRIFTKQFALPLVKLNYPGKEHLCPRITFIPVERQDKAALLQSYSLVGYTVDETQFPGIDEELGMPPRDLEAIAKRKADEADQMMQQAKLSATTYAPDDAPPKKQAA